MVDDDKLGCIGFSQGSLACWLAMANADTNSAFRAAVPDDAAHISPNLMLPNGCMTFDAPSLFIPSKIRTPGAPGQQGVSWDENTFIALRERSTPRMCPPLARWSPVANPTTSCR